MLICKFNTCSSLLPPPMKTVLQCGKDTIKFFKGQFILNVWERSGERVWLVYCLKSGTMENTWKEVIPQLPTCRGILMRILVLNRHERITETCQDHNMRRTKRRSYLHRRDCTHQKVSNKMQSSWARPRAKTGIRTCN